MKDSLWRQPYLIELTYADNFRLVEDSIRGRNLKILEVGCGTGFMSLELARRGHDVVGIDPNQKIIRIARRTMETDPYSKTRGSLRYEVADFNKWSDISRDEAAPRATLRQRATLMALLPLLGYFQRYEDP